MYVLAKYVICVLIHEIVGDTDTRTDGVCYEKTIVNGKEVRALKCCEGFYQSNERICLECSDGYYGENCKLSCIYPFYGRLCTSVCNCQRCHHIYGCTVRTTYRPVISSELPNTFLPENPLVTLEETTADWYNETSSIKYDKDLKDSAVTQREVSIVLITTISSGCTAVFIIIVLIIRKVLCKHQCIHHEAILANAELNEQPAFPQEQSFVYRRNSIPESHYETIDESKMVDTSNIKTSEDESTLLNTYNSTSSSDSNLYVGSGIASEDTEGYVHPYNALEENWQNKGYQYNSCIIKTKTRDKLQSIVIQNNAIPDFQDELIDELNLEETSNIKSNDDESTIRNSHTSSSSSDSNLSVGSGVASEDIEGYVHPYNTLEENWQNKG